MAPHLIEDAKISGAAALLHDDEKGHGLHFDFTGTSPQTIPITIHATQPIAHLALALTNTLFWDVPWSEARCACEDSCRGRQHTQLQISGACGAGRASATSWSPRSAKRAK